MKHIIAMLIFTVAMGAAYGQTLKTVSYYDNTQKLNGLALVQSKQQTGVLILPAWKGIDQEALTSSQQAPSHLSSVYLYSDINRQATQLIYKASTQGNTLIMQIRTS